MGKKRKEGIIIRLRWQAWHRKCHRSQEHQTPSVLQLTEVVIACIMDRTTARRRTTFAEVADVRNLDFPPLASYSGSHDGTFVVVVCMSLFLLD